jgi:hypothetical protein
MNRLNQMLVSAAVGATLATTALAPAAIVRITVTGTVENNAFVNNPANTFASVPVGAPVTLVMDVDSNVYLNSPNLPGKTRGYNIISGSMRFTAGNVSVLRAETTSAYFALRNNDPRADGFFISQGTDIPTDIPLQMVPANFAAQFSRTFNIDPPFPTPDDSLTSLDILAAQGTWAFNDLSVYHFAIGRGENQLPMILAYETITIAALPEPCAADLDNGSGTGTPDNAVDISDLLYFLVQFEAGSVSVDLDNGTSTGTPDGGVDVNDLLYFLARFELGC